MVKFVKIIPIALKVGTVTRKYPFERPLITESFRGAIEVDPVKCTGCGACTRICPPKALSLIREGETLILRYFVGKCIFCGMCADICPEKAIAITKEFELASENLSELNVDVEHELKKCVKCGATFVSTKLLNKVRSQVEALPDDIAELCPNCRRLEILKRFTGGR
ncbi:MAG: 4Fe-4S binding protein [Ignisphaera sp.]